MPVESLTSNLLGILPIQIGRETLLAYPIGWVIVAALIYQTGSELTARRKRR